MSDIKINLRSLPNSEPIVPYSLLNMNKLTTYVSHSEFNSFNLHSILPMNTVSATTTSDFGVQTSQLVLSSINSTSSRRISMVLFLLVFLILTLATMPQSVFGFQSNPMDSGDPLIPEQAAFRVTFYDLGVDVDPTEQSLDGTLRVLAETVHPTEWLVLDLDTVFVIHGIYNPMGVSQKYERKTGEIWIQLGRMYQPGELIDRTISYSGKPRTAANPPWSGGFTWAKTPDGSPWIGVSCQTQGADLWWPVKDHPSDRPDSVAISITVPNGLVAASNGKLLGTRERNEKTTFDWFLSTPINPYNVTVNIAPYVTISDTYISTAGDSVETTFWVLPEDEAKGKELFPQFIEQMRFYEEMLGPFAFRTEKYGIVHTPYLGMEHQTIIAYGAGFKDGALFGQHSDYDDLMHHELGHEWWGNLVSVADWKDFWIHEGITTYMQALFTEQRRGMDAYFANMQYFSTMIDNRQPLAPRESRSAGQMYQGRDVYYKGASVLHTLRYLVGDDQFFTILRRFAYPDPKMENISDGSSMRYSSTEEFKNITEKHSGISLDWFFEIYMYQPELPELTSMVQGDNLILEWKTPDDLPFNMPIEVLVNGVSSKIEFNENKAAVPISVTGEYVIDPNHWVLRKK